MPLAANSKFPATSRSGINRLHPSAEWVGSATIQLKESRNIMAQLIGIARLGKNAVLRQAGQDHVVNLALAFNYGRKDPETRNKPTQWVDAALWGKRAEVLAPYLIKGQSVMVTIDDVHLETYQGSNGEATKLVGNISNIEFAGSPPAESQGNSAPAPRQQAAAPAPRQPAQNTRAAPNFSDMDDDIPF
jgi:single-strand DNA-binding protein